MPMTSAAFVATLVAEPQEAALSDAVIARAAQALPGFAGSRWLQIGESRPTCSLRRRRSGARR